MSAQPPVDEPRRTTLVAATVQVIAAHGLGSASLSRIATAAGMSKPAVLYHVGNRDQLVTQTVEHILDRTTVVAADADSARSALFDVVERTLRTGWDDRITARAGREIRHTHPEDHARRRVTVLRELLLAGADDGSLQVSDPGLVAAALDAVLDAALARGLEQGVDSGDDDADDLIAETVNLVDRVVTPR